MLRPYKWPNILLRAAIAYLFGNGQGVIDAGSDGGPLQIITVSQRPGKREQAFATAARRSPWPRLYCGRARGPNG